MGLLKIIECKGFTKDEAFSKLNFNPNDSLVLGANATQAWKKAGRPIPGTNDFKVFVTQQLQEKTKNRPGLGIHIVLDSSKSDTRTRPYSIVNVKTDGTRNWILKYAIREDIIDTVDYPVSIENEYGEKEVTEIESELNVTEAGRIVEWADSKAEAYNKAKELTSVTKKSYSILPMKVPDLAPIAGYCIYTPSSGTKEGTFIACGIDKEITE